MAQNKFEAPSPAPSGSAGTATSYEGAAPTASQPESQSGETLLVIAYMFVWIAVLAFVVAAWRRTRGLEGRLDVLERALEKTRAAEVPSTKRSASEPP